MGQLQLFVKYFPLSTFCKKSNLILGAKLAREGLVGDLRSHEPTLPRLCVSTFPKPPNSLSILHSKTKTRTKTFLILPFNIIEKPTLPRLRAPFLNLLPLSILHSKTKTKKKIKNLSPCLNLLPLYT